MTQPAAVGADRLVAAERKTEDAVPQLPEARERLPESLDFLMVTVQRGECLSKIAARLFPEDTEYGMKVILAANPFIRDENLILEGQTLKIPKKRAGQ